MAKNELVTKFPGFTDRRICMNIVLDTRTKRRDVVFFPVVARFTYGKKVFYKPIGGTHTPEEFSDICIAKKSGTEQYKEKKRWEDIRDNFRRIVSELNPGGELTMEMVKDSIVGNVRYFDDTGNEVSFMSIWEEIVNNLKNSDRFSTGENYERGLNSFKKIMGENAVKGFDIGKQTLEKWVEGMKNGVMRNGKLVGKVSETSIGIHLRSCRVAWKEAQKRGFLRNIEYPFSNQRGKDLVAIPRGANRKDCFLSVERMTELYRVFEEKRYPEDWDKDFTANVHYSLGLFLVQYLCNGFNMADAGQLTYNTYYFASEGKAFRFNRVKTAGRSEDDAEVIVPIIEPLRYILNEIAAEPHMNDNVFPDILKGTTDAKEIRARLRQENKNVRDRLRRVTTEILEWPEEISNTWARHSFATNLRNAGVDMQYISESMGHSTGKSVTEIYLASYPLQIQMRNNSKLLKLNPEAENNNLIDINSLTQEQKMELIKKLLG